MKWWLGHQKEEISNPSQVTMTGTWCFICELKHSPSHIPVSGKNHTTCEIPVFSLVVNSFGSHLLASEMGTTHESVKVCLDISWQQPSTLSRDRTVGTMECHVRAHSRNKEWILTLQHPSSLFCTFSPPRKYVLSSCEHGSRALQLDMLSLSLVSDRNHPSLGFHNKHDFCDLTFACLAMWVQLLAACLIW